MTVTAVRVLMQRMRQVFGHHVLDAAADVDYRYGDASGRGWLLFGTIVNR